MGLDAGGLDKFLGRTLESLHKKQLLTPHFERALLGADWPEEYAIRVVNKERIWDGRFHPSGDADADLLYLYYRFHPDYHLDYERPSPELEMTFQIGNAYHAVVQSMLIHLGFTSMDECERGFVNDKHWCSGTLDIRKVFLPNGDTPPVEIKSTGWLPKEPMIKHQKQLQIYMDLGCEEPQERGILLYVEKSQPHRLLEFVIQRDETMLKEIYTKWALVREAIELGDQSLLRECCVRNTKDHWGCPARHVCRIGSPEARR